MKFSKLEIRKKIFCFVTCALFLFSTFIYSFAQVNDLTPRAPVDLATLDKLEESIPTPIDLKTIPNFPVYLDLSNNPITISFDSILKVTPESFIDIKKTIAGDYFKAHTIEDFYIPTNPTQLLIPKGSSLRGRITFVKRPNIIIMAGKLGVHVDEIITPLGEVTLVNAELKIQEGLLDSHGVLNPTAIEKQIEANSSETTINHNANLINILFSGDILAIGYEVNKVGLFKGQELQLILKKQLRITD